jgi:DNA (cytosine-5)-methyltransferase 1
MIGMTVCSGIGAPEVSAPWIDWRYQSEIEPFPCAVLAHRFPHAVNLGDMTRFQEWPDATVDVLCGGTPCQSFSVAGLRKGLDDPRGNLMLTYLAIADRYRPRWIVWENVPGVLSSNGGRDFGAFLGAMGQLGYGFAYRVLDAQYTRTREFPRAVPQRRRRVFVVGHLGDWRRAAAVLFDGESLRGHPPPRREAGQVAPTVPSRSSAGGGLGSDFDCDGGLIPAISPAMKARDHKAPSSDGADDGLPLIPVAHALRGEGFDASEDGTGRRTPLVPVHAIQAGALRENPDSGPDGVGVQEGHAYTLEARAEVQAVAFHNRQDPDISGAVTHPLGSKDNGLAFMTPWAVRRLTPTECERLMGFPDGWTRIPYRGKAVDACPDGPRYKALGNSWAVNCGQLVFDRLRMVEETRP